MESLFDSVFAQRLLLGDEAKRTTERGVEHQCLFTAQHLQRGDEIAFAQLLHREQVERAVLQAGGSHSVCGGGGGRQKQPHIAAVK
jgi:hypothetical protein